MVENPGLAVHVYALSLPVAFADVQRQPFSVELNLRLQELQHVLKRALSYTEKGDNNADDNERGGRQQR
jgi:hypothetical protein